MAEAVDDRRSLRQRALDAIPAQNRDSVGLSSLPYLRAHQEDHRTWLASRPDRFSQLLATGPTSRFVGDRLLTQATPDMASAREELMAVAPRAAEDLAEELELIGDKLREILASLDPVAMLAHASFAEVFSTWGSYHEPSHEGSEVHVEVIFGLYAGMALDSDLRAPTPDDVQEVRDLVRELDQVVHLRNMALRFSEDEGAQLTFLSTAEWMRLRGESYIHHAREVTEAILQPSDALMMRVFGYTISDFFAVADAVVALIERRVNEDVRETRATLLSQTAQLGPEERLRALLEALVAIPDHTKDLLSFTVDDVAAEGRASSDLVLKVFDSLTTTNAPGSTKYQTPFDDNPIFARPFFRDEEGRYILPVPGHLLRAAHKLFEPRLLASDPRFSRHRAAVLDVLAVDLIGQCLSGSVSATSLYYEFDDGDGVQRYETDGLVLFEDHVVIVEGKAGSVSVAARRGDLERMRRDLSKSLEEAWSQAARVYRYIRTQDGATFSDERGQPKLKLPAEIKSVLFVCPTLHPLGVFSYHLPTLRRLGLFGEEGQPWPVLITDLRVITEMVRSPAEFLHYLRWRLSLPVGDRMFVFDELDVFGAYLFGEVGRTELADNEILTFGSSTVDFDAFYAGELGDAPPVERPRRVLGELIESWIVDLATDRPRRWLEASFALLDLPLVEAAGVTFWVEREARGAVRSGWAAQQVGGTFVVALSRTTTFSDVMWEVGRAQRGPTRIERRIIVRLTEGTTLHSAQRMR